jgi:hypothetical protein
MSDVFISYSRHDREFVRRLHDRLAAEQRDVWVDWEDIPPSARWRPEIERAIEGADTFVCVLSPSSIGSDMCGNESDYAARCHKRIVPLVISDIEASQVRSTIADVNWLFFRPSDSFEDAFKKLLTTIDTDLDWVRAHSRLLVRAREWEMHEKDKSYLLAGSELEESERLLAQSVARTPTPNALQVAYVAASRSRETERQRNQLRGFYLVSLVYGVLQSAVSYFVAFDEISEEGLIALSPLWVLGIVFGGFGLTLGRSSLRRSVIATAIGGILLYVFFLTLWQVL